MMSAPDVFVVGFGTNQEPMSKLVRNITGSPWSHSWIEYSSLSFGGLWAVHAQKTGVIKERIFDVWRKYPTRKRFEIKHDIREGIKIALAAVGKPYDFRSVFINSIILYWWRMTGKLVADPVRDATLYSCSELVTVALIESEFPGANTLDPELTTPGMLFEFCSRRPGLFREM